MSVVLSGGEVPEAQEMPLYTALGRAVQLIPAIL